MSGVDDDTIAGIPAHAIVNDSGSLASKAKTYAPAFAVDHSGADFAEAHNHARIGYVRDFIKWSSPRARWPPVAISRGFSRPW
jgi:hypothetical protein